MVQNMSEKCANECRLIDTIVIQENEQKFNIFTIDLDLNNLEKNIVIKD